MKTETEKAKTRKEAVTMVMEIVKAVYPHRLAEAKAVLSVMESDPARAKKKAALLNKRVGYLAWSESLFFATLGEEYEKDTIHHANAARHAMDVEAVMGPGWRLRGWRNS